MLLMENKNYRDKLIIILISFFVIFVAVFPLFNKGFPRTHDTNLYMSWLYEFDQGFREGSILPRWSANLWLGFGAPVFNYLQPFFYYLSEGFHLLGFSLVISIKLSIILSVVLSFFLMFLMAKEFWGKWPALVLATLYIYLPYRIGLLYIRGDFSEYMATAWFPLILFSFHKLLKTEKLGYFLLSSFSIALLFLTHNIQTVLFLPILFIYILVFFWGKIKKILKSILAIIYGALLAGFFWIPAFFERKYIQVERLATGRYDFHNHFIALKELFLPHWSIQSADFQQIGAISILIIIFTIYILIKHKKLDFNGKHLLFFFILVIFGIFLTNKVSTFIWENFPLLSSIQYPWRILSLVAFGLAIMGSIIVFPEFYQLFIKQGTSKKFFIILTFFIFIFSLALFFVWNTAKPIIYILSRSDIQYNVYYQIFDDANKVIIDDKDSIGAQGSTELNFYASLPEILPKGVDIKLAMEKMEEIGNDIMHTVLDKQQSYYLDKLIVLSGKIKILKNTILVEDYQFDLDVEESAQVRVNTFWLPGWHAYIDGKEVSIDKNNPLDLMDINVPAGEHVLKIEFHNTPLRNIAAYISIISFFVFLVTILLLLVKKLFTRLRS